MRDYLKIIALLTVLNLFADQTVEKQVSKQKLFKNFGKVGSWTGGIRKKCFKNVKLKL